MKDQHKLEKTIMERLEEIKPVPARDPQMASRARAQFLSQAVSASEFQRHKGRKSIFRKERFAMNTILSVLVIAGLLFGGGATVNAAQNDLPNEPLYAVKTWSEDVGLQFQNNPEEKVNSLMELTNLRVQEMTQLAEAGQTPPDHVRLRLAQHIQQALQICNTMDDPTLDRMLLQIRDQLRQRDQDMERLRLRATQDAQPILERTRTMLQQRLHLVEAGLVNHEAFRNAARNSFNFGQEPESTPPAQNGNGQQNGQPILQPGDNGNGNGPGPNTDPGGPNLNATPLPTCTGDCLGPNNDSGGNNNGGADTDTGGNNNDTGGNQDSGGSGSGSDGSEDNGSGGNGK